jgi:hypothetical protein
MEGLMMATTQRRTVIVSLCAVAVLAVSGCGGGGTASSASSHAATSATAPTSASSAASQTYSSKAFVVPLTVTVDPALQSPPNRDSSHLLTWDAAATEENKVRFMVPVVVFRPENQTPETPPKEEYLKFLMAQTNWGAEFSKVSKITVDGRPATLMDVTTNQEVSGSLGCIERVSNKHADSCFGLQPDYHLRLAVIDVGDTTLLAWARTGIDNPDEAFRAMFERMLTAVRFR